MHSINGSKTPIEISDLWQTPREIYDYLNAIYTFNLDAYANENDHLCPNYIGESDNAHIVDWRTYTNGDPVVAFCNPPYSQPNIKLCLGAARREAERGGTALVLIPNQPSKYWLTHVIDQANLIQVLVGRVSFIHPLSGKPKQGNAGGSIILAFHPRDRRARCVVSETSYKDLESMYE